MNAGGQPCSAHEKLETSLIIYMRYSTVQAMWDFVLELTSNKLANSYSRTLQFLTSVYRLKFAVHTQLLICNPVPEPFKDDDAIGTSFL